MKKFLYITILATALTIGFASCHHKASAQELIEMINECESAEDLVDLAEDDDFIKSLDVLPANEQAKVENAAVEKAAEFATGEFKDILDELEEIND